MLIKTKVSPMKEWPSPKGSPVGPRHKAATPGKSLTIFEKESGKDSRPWNSTKVCPYDKQT